MSHVAAIAGRELRSMFSTPTAYAVLTVYTVLGGLLFFLGLRNFFEGLQYIQAQGALQYLEMYNLNQAVITPWLAAFGFILLLVVPVLTMRTFAEERALGTIELLLTSPVSALQLVLGKYVAILAMVLVLTGITALYPGLLFLYGDPELWQTVAGLMALFLYGAALAAIGCFVSALTRSQILAALVTIAIGLLLILADSVSAVGASGPLVDVARYLSSETHFQNGIQGKVYGEDLVYFFSIIVLFLFLARHGVEWLRWR